MPLRKFDATHIDQKVDISGTVFNSLLYNCGISDLRGVALINCVLNQSKVLIDDIAKLKGFACTMDCGTFRNVELSETVFDCIAMLLYSTKGNDTKRRKLLSIIGKERFKALTEQMEQIDIGC